MKRLALLFIFACTQGGAATAQESPCVPDGATCRVAEPGTPQVYQYRPDKPFTLPKSDHGVVFGSVSVDLLTPTDSVLLTVPGRYLHGHDWLSRFTVAPILDHRTGRFHDARRRFANHCKGSIGTAAGDDGRLCRLRVTYTPAASPARIETPRADTLDAAAFGITPGPSGSADIQPELAWATHTARRTGASVLRFGCGEYSYAGAVAWPDGLTLLGCGGAVLVTDTLDVMGADSTAVVYRAAREIADPKRKTVLRVGDGMLDTPGSGSIKAVLGHAQTAIFAEPGLMYARLENVVFDGNWEGNLATIAGLSRDEREVFRNTPSYAAFAATNHGRVYIPEGQRIEVENVVVRNYGSQGLLGNGRATWTGNTVRCDGNGWNHCIYGTDGVWQNLTLAGPAWAHAILYDSEITNLVYEDGDRRLADGRTLPDLLNVRGNRGPRLTVKGGMLDFRGSPFRIAFSLANDSLAVSDLVVVADSARGVQLVQGRKYPDDVSLTDITILETGRSASLYNTQAKDVARVSDAEVTPAVPYRTVPLEPPPPAVPRYVFETVSYTVCRDTESGRFVASELCND